MVIFYISLNLVAIFFCLNLAKIRDIVPLISCLQDPAAREQLVVNAVYSRSFTATDDTPVVPQSILKDARGALSLQAMTWTNCGVIVQDEEVRNKFIIIIIKIMRTLFRLLVF